MSVAKVISDYIADRDFAKASEIAAFIVTKVEEELIAIPLPRDEPSS
jgi:hypothetical protein